MITPGNINTIGQTVVWTITVTNGLTNNIGVAVNLALPPGWAFVPSDVVQQGSRVGNTWTIGAMTAGQVVIGAFYIQKTVDLLNSPWNFIATVSGLDTNGADNVLTDTVTLGVCADCPPSGGAIDDPWACLCGNVLANDTLCTAGITTAVPDMLSLDNCSLLYFNNNTGQYFVQPVDPTLPWSFNYSLWCDTGGGAVEVSGPAHVSGPAVFPSWVVMPKLVQEDFTPAIGDTKVTLTAIPRTGFPVFVYRDGSLLFVTEWSIVADEVTFSTAFAASGGGAYSQTATIIYYQ